MVLSPAVRAVPAAWPLVGHPAIPVVATAAGAWLVGAAEVSFVEAAECHQKVGPVSSSSFEDA